MKVQVKRTGKLLKSPSEKGQGNIVNLGQRTGLILLYVW